MQDDLKAIPCALPGHTVCYVAAQVFLTGLLPQECHVLVTRQDLSPAGSLLPFSRHPVLSHTSFGSWLSTFALQESFSFTSSLFSPSPFLPVLPPKTPTVLQGFLLHSAYPDPLSATAVSSMTCNTFVCTCTFVFY